MRNFAAILALAALLPGPAAASAADDPFVLRCEREMKPRLEVSVREAPFGVVNTVSSRRLNTRYRLASVSQMTIGLTASTTRTEISVNAPSLTAPGGARECASPRIYVDVSYDPLQVFVAREFNPYSCSYRAVYEHEMRHVALYRERLPQLEQTVRAELERHYGNRPLYAPAGAALRQLDAEVDAWLRPFVKGEVARIEALQLDLDTPEELFRLSHACHGELAGLLGSSLL